MVVYTLEQRWQILRHVDFFDFVKKKIMFSDEAHFDLGGYVNKENCRIWRTENPHAYIKKPKHPKGFVYASLSGPAIDLQKLTILSKWNHLFRWSSFWSWRVCKQTKMSHLGHRKPARIHWKTEALKTVFVRILVQRHNWVILLRKWSRRGRYSQCR